MAYGKLKTTSVLVPELSLPPEKTYELRLQHLDNLLKRTVAELPDIYLVIRDLEPTDVGLAQDDWRLTTGATARVWAATTIAASVIADSRFVAIFGVADISAEQAVGGLRVESENSLVAQWALDPLWAYESHRGIALTPVVVKQNLTVTVRWYVKIPNAPVELVLVGAVCEKEGLRLKI